ncbi:MAG: flavin-nucleotide-binding protein [Candidatus Heimdallarchaeota archaeon]|nr:flavin-nucleotide-binding protein [Candidatus Heimdallarchaeota archaeon]
MRRNELESQSYKSDFDFLCNKVDIGHLGVVDINDYPRIIPLNFVAIDWDIFFHGSLEGEKHDLLKKNPKATFSVDLPYSFLPSYWISEKYACPASHYFKSLFIRGVGSLVENIDEKARVLQKMMEKYQPEGQYTPISSDLSLYKKALENVGVYKIKMDDLSIKIKFGQNESDAAIMKIIDGLRERGSEIDQLTIDEIVRLREKL